MALEAPAGVDLVSRRNRRDLGDGRAFVEGLIERLEGVFRDRGRRRAVNHHRRAVATAPGGAPSLSFKVFIAGGYGRLVTAGEATRPLTQVREEALLVAGVGWRDETRIAVAVECSLGLFPRVVEIVVSG